MILGPQGITNFNNEPGDGRKLYSNHQAKDHQIKNRIILLADVQFGSTWHQDGSRTASLLSSAGDRIISLYIKSANHKKSSTDYRDAFQTFTGVHIQ